MLLGKNRWGQFSDNNGIQYGREIGEAMIVYRLNNKWHGKRYFISPFQYNLYCFKGNINGYLYDPRRYMRKDGYTLNDKKINKLFNFTDIS